jgi:hypothetical protein
VVWNKKPSLSNSMKMREKMGNELPLVKSATSTLYRELAFLNTTAFSLVTKAGASTIPQDLHKGVGMPSSARSFLIFLGPPRVV